MRNQRARTFFQAASVFNIIKAAREYQEYFVDTVRGDPANSGKSPSQSVRNINPILAAYALDPDAKIPNVRFENGEDIFGTINVLKGGDPNRPLIFTRYGDAVARPKITGQKRLLTWTSVAGNIWKTATPFGRIGSLYINNVEQRKAQFTESYMTADSYNAAEGKLTIPGKASSSAEMTGAQVMCKVRRFSKESEFVQSFNNTTKVVTLSSPFKSDVETNNGGFYVKIYGKAEWLSKPHTQDGDYAYVNNNGVDEVHMYHATNPNTLEINGSFVDQIFDFGERNIEHVLFDELDIQYARYNGINASGNTATTRGIEVKNVGFRGCGKAGVWLYSNQQQKDIKVVGQLGNPVTFDRCGLAVNISAPIGLEVGHVRATNMALGDNLAGLIQQEFRTYNYNSVIGCYGYQLDAEGEVVPANVHFHDIAIENAGQFGIKLQGRKSKIDRVSVKNVMLDCDDGAAIYSYSHQIDTAILRSEDIQISNFVIDGVVGNTDGYSLGGTPKNSDGVYMDNGTRNVSIHNGYINGVKGEAIRTNALSRDIAWNSIAITDSRVHASVVELIDGTEPLQTGHSFRNMLQVSNRFADFVLYMRNYGTRPLAPVARSNIKIFSRGTGNLYQTFTANTQVNNDLPGAIAAGIETASATRQGIDNVDDNFLFVTRYGEGGTLVLAEQVDEGGTLTDTISVEPYRAKVFVRQSGTLRRVDIPDYTTSVEQNEISQGDPAGTLVATLISDMPGDLTWEIIGGDIAAFRLEAQLTAN